MSDEWNPNAPEVKDSFDKSKEIPKPETVTKEQLDNQRAITAKAKEDLETPTFEPAAPGIDKNLQAEMSRRNFEKKAQDYEEKLKVEQYLERRMNRVKVNRDFRRSR